MRSHKFLFPPEMQNHHQNQKLLILFSLKQINNKNLKISQDWIKIPNKHITTFLDFTLEISNSKLVESVMIVWCKNHSLLNVWRVEYGVPARLDQPTMDANASPATVDEDFGVGGFQVVLVDFQFHRCFLLLRASRFLFLVQK